MEKKKWKLVGSAASKENLQKLINEYYYSTGYVVTEDDRIYNTIKEKFLDEESHRVIYKKDRWRYEWCIK